MHSTIDTTSTIGCPIKFADEYSLRQVKSLGNVPTDVAIEQGIQHFNNVYALAELQKKYDELKTRHEAMLLKYHELEEKIKREGIGL